MALRLRARQQIEVLDACQYWHLGTFDVDLERLHFESRLGGLFRHGLDVLRRAVRFFEIWSLLVSWLLRMYDGFFTHRKRIGLDLSLSGRLLVLHDLLQDVMRGSILDPRLVIVDLIFNR